MTERAPTSVPSSGPAAGAAPPRRRMAAIVAVVVVVVASLVGTAVRRATIEGTDDAMVRTSTVTNATFDETLRLVGTVEPVIQASVGFPASGTVTELEVTVGDRVGAGQVLARQDTTDLERAVHERQAELDQRRLTYTRLASGTSTGSGSVTGSGGSSDSGVSAIGGQTTGGAPTAQASGATTSGSESAEALYAAQLDITTAQLALTAAQDALAQATLTSPIAGSVAAVGLSVGASASTTDAVVVVGDGGYEVTVDVAVDDVRTVAVGQPATVRPDGRDLDLSGSVARIGVSPDDSSDPVTYPVTIAVTDGQGLLRNGALATVTITTAAAVDAVAVPTSAVTVDGDRATVQVVAPSGVETVEIGTGAVGATWTEVTSGLDTGQVVVLADLTQPLPSSATEASTSTGRGADGGGGFVGGAFPGGGAGGMPQLPTGAVPPGG